MRSTYRLALALGLIGLGAASVEAAENPAAEDPGAPTVRVINNYQTSVRVYLEDAEGRLHRMGTVARSEVKIVEISAEVAERGAYQIRVFPNTPVWSPVSDDIGVRTPDLRLADGEALNFWIEPNLRSSKLEFTTG